MVPWDILRSCIVIISYGRRTLRMLFRLQFFHVRCCIAAIPPGFAPVSSAVNWDRCRRGTLLHHMRPTPTI
jgi:hypothetical protein